MGKLQTNRPILKKRFLLLCLIGYLLTTLVLLCWIKRLQPQPQPKINEISVDKKSATLSIRGDGLSEGLDAVISFSPEHGQAIISTKFTWGYVSDIKIHDNIAWVANGPKGLISYDLNNPNRPQVMGSIELPGKARSITISGHFAMVSDPQYGLFIVDILQPDQPKLVSRLQLPGQTYEIVVTGDKAIIAAGTAGVHTVDISNKRLPTIISSLQLDGIISSVSIYEQIGYVSGMNKKNTAQGIVYSIDISTPSTLKRLNKTELPTRVLDTQIINERLFCGTNHGLYAFDLNEGGTTNPGQEMNPDIVARRLLYMDKELFIADRHNRIHQYSINHKTMQYKKTFVTNGSCRNMATNGHIAVIANATNGLSIIDLRLPGETKDPILTLGYGARRLSKIIAKDDTLLIQNGVKLHIVKKNHQNTYERVNTLSFPKKITHIITDDNRAYLTVKTRGIYSVDFSHDDSQPTLILPLQQAIRCMTIKDERLYLCQVNDDILTIDISDKSKPTILPAEGFPSNARSMIIHNNLAYVATFSTGLDIYTVQKGKAPTLLTRLEHLVPMDLFGTITDMQRKGDFIFFSGRQGLLSVDVSSALKPKIADSINTTHQCRSIQIVGNYAYVQHIYGIMGDTTLIDIANPKKMKQLCELNSYRNFTVSKNKIFSFVDGELTIDKLPIVLKKRQISPNEVIFQLPTELDSRKYDLHLSNGHQLKTYTHELTYDKMNGWSQTCTLRKWARIDE